MGFLKVTQGRLWISRELSPNFCMLRHTVCNDPRFHCIQLCIAKGK